MKKLQAHPDLTIQEVASMYGCTREELRNEQLSFLKSVLNRNSGLWDKDYYGR